MEREKTPPISKYLYEAIWLNQQRWFCWWPVIMGGVIFYYFTAAMQPPMLLLTVSFFIMATFGVLWLCKPRIMAIRFLFLGMIAVILSMSACFYRSSQVDTYFLKNVYGPIALTGNILDVDVGIRGSKYTLSVRKYYRWASVSRPQERLPQKIVLTVGIKSVPQFEVGQDIYVGNVRLMPLASSLGRYDFRRFQAYMKGIGGRGLAMSAPKLDQRKERRKTVENYINAVRNRITVRLYDSLPDQIGAIAAALITGKRGAIDSTTYEAFSSAGLSHLLAISGLHLTLVASILYGMIHVLLRAIPYLALHYNLHRWALFCALVGAGGYATLSGLGIPVQRSLIMLSIFMVGSAFYRQVFSMRSVALAAVVILTIRPENLLSISFQLSFAAVVGLIAVFENLHPKIMNKISNGFLRYCMFLVLSSVVAGLMTLPFTIFYFHKFSLQTIAANLIAIPLTGFVILPLAITACLTEIVGLSKPILQLMGWGIDYLISIAGYVSGWPGSFIPVVRVSSWFLCFNVVGLLWLCLWVGKVRWWGFLSCLLSLIWLTPRMPNMVMSSDGRLLGAIVDGKLWVNNKRAKKFDQKVWLQQYVLKGSVPWLKKGNVSDSLEPVLERKGATVLFRNVVGGPAFLCSFLSSDLRQVDKCFYEGKTMTLEQLKKRGPLEITFSREHAILDWSLKDGFDRPWL